VSQPSPCHENDTFCLIALGSNVTSHAGTPDQTLEAAIRALETDSFRICAKSRLFRTPCFPPGAGADFVNAAAAACTRLPAEEVLAHLHRIERDFARERRTRWAARTLDLDLLDYGGAVRPDAATYAHWRNLPLENQRAEAPEDLILPHPRLQDRAFVLVPLADIVPDWCHPVLGRTVTEMLKALPADDKAPIRPILRRT